MKKIIRIITAIIFLTTSNLNLALAEDPMVLAQKAVQASLAAASKNALSAVRQDFNMSISETLREIYQDHAPKSLHDTRKTLITEQEELLKQFSHLADMNPEQVAQLKVAAQQAYDDYKAAIRKRFDASFIMPEYRYDAGKSLIYASRALAKFENTCKVGRGVGADGITLFDYPDLPESNIEFYVSLGNADQSSFSVNQQGTGTQGELNRQNINNVTTNALGIMTTIAIQNSAGATTAFCQAAMPYAWGVGIAILAVNLYMGHRERIKAENRIAEAKLYAFINMANDSNVGSYYREHCADMSEQTKQIRDILNAAINNPEKLENLANSMGDIDQALIDLQNLIKERDAIRAEIERLVKIREVSETAEARENAQALLEKQAEAYKISGQKIMDATDANKLASLMAKILLTRQSQIQNEFAELNWSAVDAVQRQAFGKIQKLLNLVSRQSAQKYLGAGSDISAELKAISEFESSRLLFKKVVAANVKRIFGRIDLEDYSALAGQLKVASDNLMKKYGHLDEVLEFARLVKALLSEKI